MISLKCKCCGKKFASKYWEGGYIDHVENFVGNKEVFVYRNDAVDMAWEIIFNGNDLRELRHIREFLKCFMTWDCFSKDFKNRVKQMVDAMLEKLEKAHKRVKQINKEESPLVLALLKEEKIDDAFNELFDGCHKEVK